MKGAVTMTVDKLLRRLNDLSEQGYGGVDVVVTADGKEVLWQLEGDVGVDLTDLQDANKLTHAEEVEPDNPNAVVVLI
jgi:hypothetical protein